MIQHSCPVKSVKRLRANMADVTVYAGAIAETALPGQFIHIKCGDGTFLRRPISICDIKNDELRFVFEIKGAGTAWLSSARRGDVLDVLGPLGRGFSLDRAGDSPLFVGGGIGAPPMLFAAKKAPERARVILGFKSAALVILEDEFEDISDLSVATDDGTRGFKGLADALIRQEAAHRPISAIYACGPKPMLRAVKKVSEELSVFCEISMEERMGCGVGACLGCVCKTKDHAGHEDGFTYSHVCKDGPVFDASEVIFDD